MSRTLLKLAATCLLAIPLAGCDSFGDRDARVANGDVDFWVEPSDTDIVAGEIVTFTAHSRDTIGRHAEVKWSSTAGKVDTEAGGRIARVKFDEAGAYTVKSQLVLDGVVTHEDAVDIDVHEVD